MNKTDSLAFFTAQADAFAETLAACRGREDLIGGLLSQAFSSFDGNVAMEAGDYPAVACHKGCATCCTLRVTATAPEVLLIARFIRWSDRQNRALNLAKRVTKADQSTRGLDEAERVKLRKTCPFIQRGVCTIYPVRPLACRGHACYDRRACVDAASGQAKQIPLSEPHRLFRGLIQNAMQLALRDAGYVWALYELNQAVTLALENADCESRWTEGGETFAAAEVGEVSRDEMALIFDRIKSAAV